MTTFEGFGLHRVLVISLAHMKYTTPTPIQAQAIPIALQGRDIMGSAQTGTGKTAAFAIPLVNTLLRSERGTAIVLTPTRELGKQVMDVIHQLLGPKSNIKTAFLIGGESMGKQCAQLQKRPRLIVGTPGRVNDHLDRKNLFLDQTEFLVLDETDRMLDMGFSVQIDRIVKHIPKERQTLMFSATMPKNIMAMADKYLNNPQRIEVGSTHNPAKNIKQDILHVNNENKYTELVREMRERSGSIVVFVKTKHGADKMAKKLSNDDFATDTIHGDLKQSKRDRVIKDYRAKKFRILVATDVIARGLDIPHIEHVINYDLPQMPEDYIHRIGRTARAGAEGSALCMITPQDGRKWQAIEQLMFPEKYPNGAPTNAPSGNRSKKRSPFKGNRSNGRPSENGENKGGFGAKKKYGAKPAGKPNADGKKVFQGNKKKRPAFNNNRAA